VRVTFTPDGRFIIAGASDDKATLWSVDTPSTTHAVIDIAHGPTDGSIVAADNGIVTLPAGGQALPWNINADNLLAHACAVAGRNLTKDELSQIVPDPPYERTCPDQA